MAKVLTHMCMSLDGVVARPDEDKPAELFDWYWNGDVVVTSAQESIKLLVDAASTLMLRGLTSGCGRRWSRAGDADRSSTTRPAGGAR